MATILCSIGMMLTQVLNQQNFNLHLGVQAVSMHAYTTQLNLSGYSNFRVHRTDEHTIKKIHNISPSIIPFTIAASNTCLREHFLVEL